MTSAHAGRSTRRSRVPTWGRLALTLLLTFSMHPLLAADTIRLEIDGVDRAMADNVRAYLSLSRYLQRTDLTDDQVRRLADRAVDEASDALRPYGYYDPQVRSRTVRDAPGWVVRLKVKPGEPVVMREVQVDIVGAGQDDTEIRNVVTSDPLRTGVRLDHPAYEKFKTDLVRTALEQGYLDAKLTRHELDVDPQEHAADVRLVLDTGGRYRFGKVTIEQDAIDPEHLQGFIRFTEGKPFSATLVRSTQFALEDSFYFSSVTVTPGPRDPETLTVPITIRAERIKRDRYAASVGFGTDTGPRGQFAWDRRLVNEAGHRWRLQTTLSKVLQDVTASYIIPIGDPSLEKLEFSAGYVSETLGGLESERYEVAAGLTQVMGSWQRVLFAQLSQELTKYPGNQDTRSLLLIPGISFATQPPNFLTGWDRNAAYYFELSGSPASLGSDASWLRFYARGERVWAIDQGPWFLRLRGEFGTTWTTNFSQVPGSQRFFAGGDNSVRGFALDSLSPRDPDAPPGSGNKGVGGKNLVVASIGVERDLPHDLRGALFFDTGNAFDDWNTPLEYSVGVGLRYRLPMLMIGFDVAQALSEPDKRPRLHLNITQVL
ncbi:MAG: autotransporter assembly complex family protein [Steroidobacteraceae bacterium]